MATFAVALDPLPHGFARTPSGVKLRLTRMAFVVTSVPYGYFLVLVVMFGSVGEQVEFLFRKERLR